MSIIFSVKFNENSTRDLLFSVKIY